MHRSRWTYLLPLVVAAVAAAGPGVEGEVADDPRDWRRQVVAFSVRADYRGEELEAGAGTGVVVRERGEAWLVTAEHVARRKDGRDLRVGVYEDGGTDRVFSAVSDEVAGPWAYGSGAFAADKPDLAVAKLREDSRVLKAVVAHDIGPGPLPRLAEPATLIGVLPRGRLPGLPAEPVVVACEVSALRPTGGPGAPPRHQLEFAVPVVGGMSGGGVFTRSAEGGLRCAGVITEVRTRYDIRRGVGVAEPVGEVRRLIAFADGASDPADGPGRAGRPADARIDDTPAAAEKADAVPLPRTPGRSVVALIADIAPGYDSDRVAEEATGFLVEHGGLSYLVTFNRFAMTRAGQSEPRVRFTGGDGVGVERPLAEVAEPGAAWVVDRKTGLAVLPLRDGAVPVSAVRRLDLADGPNPAPLTRLGVAAAVLNKGTPVERGLVPTVVTVPLANGSTYALRAGQPRRPQMLLPLTLPRGFEGSPVFARGGDGLRVVGVVVGLLPDAGGRFSVAVSASDLKRVLGDTTAGADDDSVEVIIDPPPNAPVDPSVDPVPRRAEPGPTVRVGRGKD